MSLEELLILLPCHSLEDFPMYLDSEQADDLLAAWTAPWHPELIAAAGAAPRWQRADEPPEVLTGRMVFVPQVSQSLLLAGWTARAKSQGAVVLQNEGRRDQLVQAALAQIDRGRHVASELVDDFLALGFLFLQTELLTRQMRYMSNIDEVHFQSETLRAAEAAVAGDELTARKHLQQCFEVLAEARERFYPVEAYLIDLTLTAETTLGTDLTAELQRPEPLNLLLCGEHLERLANQFPEQLALLRERIDEGTVSVVGGEYSERELSLLPLEAVYEELRRGGACYERHLGQRPRVFGRRRFGLTPMLPQVLSRWGYAGALHFTLDDGRFPTSDQSRIQWEGIDGSVIDALARLPLDGAEADSFLRLPAKLGESMDTDFVATSVFAHWPGRSCLWYDDLRNGHRYAPVLGRFVTLEEYFRQTDAPGVSSRFHADAYRSPYLRQAVAMQRDDAVSHAASDVEQQAVADGVSALECFDQLLGHGRSPSEPMPAATTRGSSSAAVSEGVAIPTPESSASACEQESSGLSHDVNTDGDEPFSSDSGGGPSSRSASAPSQTVEGGPSSDLCTLPRPSETHGGEFVSRLRLAAERLARALSSSSADRPAEGALLLNPLSFSRTLATGATLSHDQRCTIVERAELGKTPLTNAVVEVPGCGFAWVAAGEQGAADSAPKRARRRRQKPLAEDHVLRNEFFQIAIDPVTGAIRSVHDARHRGNRLSQQIALRRPAANEGANSSDTPYASGHAPTYSVMAADRLEVLDAGPTVGAIAAEGRLLDHQGHRLAGFRQVTRVERGSPVIWIDIELKIDEPPGQDPWESYYAARLAWADAGAELRRSLHGVSVPTEAARIEAPWFLEIRSVDSNIALLTGGLPYHRRVDLRKLDTILVAGNERRRRFRLGIGMDAGSVASRALDFLSPFVLVQGMPQPGGEGRGWLFHIDKRNVVATHWQPVIHENQVVGCRMRLLETAGRACRVAVRSFLPLTEARQVDFLGRTLAELPRQQETTTVELTNYEWAEIQLRFAP